MSRILLDQVSFSYPLRRMDARAFSREGGAGDPRIIAGRNGRPKHFRVLSDLSFALEKGDRLAIIGRNGSGKSTLLRVLHGIFPPDSGQMTVDGITDALFEINLGTRPLASGYQNVVLAGLMRGHTREEIEAVIADIVQFSDLGDFMDLPLGMYSAGMRMRLLFAVATAFDPDILLLDEWISAGDADFKKKAQVRMKAHVEKAGIIVLASHSVQLLRSICSKALWLEKGEIVGFGELEPVFSAFDEVVHKGTTSLQDARARLLDQGQAPLRAIAAT